MIKIMYNKHTRHSFKYHLDAQERVMTKADIMTAICYDILNCFVISLE